jgi:hypothetical protein
MALKVIGSGFGRTGTKSAKDALEHLGFGPCHHMYEVIENPPQVAFWQDISAGRPVDWNTVFNGYNSQVDWPGAHVWRELATAFPEAKVLHTRRPENSWVKSFSRTIGKLMHTYPAMELPPHIKDMMDATFHMVSNQTFTSGMDTEEGLLAAYRQRTEDVMAAIPPERLLVFDVAEGWEPLCAFLDVPVPDTPFPHQNVRADFWDRLGGEPDR